MILSPYQKPPIGSKINPKHRFSKGLAGLWLMNEMSGDRVWDYSGNGNHGTCMNMSPQSPTSGWGPGPHGGALAFDGSNDYVDCSKRINWSNYIITLVVRAKTIATANQRLISLRTGLGDLSEPQYFIRFAGANATVFGRGLAEDVLKTGTIVVNDGLYHDIVGIINGLTGTVYLYVDSNYEGFSGGAGAFANNSMETTYIGSFNGLVLPQWLNGAISHASIYNRALSAEEIAYLYAFPYCMFEDEGLPAWMIGNTVGYDYDYTYRYK